MLSRTFRIPYFSENNKTLQALKLEGYKHIRYIDGLGYCATMRMFFTYGLYVGLTECGRFGRYCYRSELEAVNALNDLDNKSLLPKGKWIVFKGKYITFNRIPDPVTMENYRI